MKALSILQPWPYAIIVLGKDIENRTWSTSYRGRFLIHASKGFDMEGYDVLLRMKAENPDWPEIPRAVDFQRGGIVGSVVLRDVVRASTSPWFFGPVGFVLQGAQPLPFNRCRGMPGFFEPVGDGG
jgi:hypothetical protein